MATKVDHEEEEEKHSIKLLLLDSYKVLLSFFSSHSQPPTVVCKTEAQSEHAHIAHTFLHISRRLVCSVGAY